MRLDNLGEAIRSVIRTAPKEPALAVLAGAGQNGAILATEFKSAARSLAERLQPGARRASSRGDIDAVMPWM